MTSPIPVPTAAPTSLSTYNPAPVIGVSPTLLSKQIENRGVTYPPVKITSFSYRGVTYPPVKTTEHIIGVSPTLLLK